MCLFDTNMYFLISPKRPSISVIIWHQEKIHYLIIQMKINVECNIQKCQVFYVVAFSTHSSLWTITQSTCTKCKLGSYLFQMSWQQYKCIEHCFSCKRWCWNDFTSFSKTFIMEKQVGMILKCHNQRLQTIKWQHGEEPQNKNQQHNRKNKCFKSAANRKFIIKNGPNTKHILNVAKTNNV